MNTTTTIEKLIDSIANICINLGLRGEYSPEEIVDLVCDIEFVHLYDALRDQAETVYAYSTDGDRSMTLKSALCVHCSVLHKAGASGAASNWC